MAGQLIIDGYNLLWRGAGKAPGGEDLEQARKNLLIRLAAFKIHSGKRIVVVFDGNQSHPPQGAERLPGGIEVEFAGGREGADERIKQMVSGALNAGAITVVTSDRRIREWARGCGATVVSSEELTARMSHKEPAEQLSEKYDRSLSAREVDEWMALFKQSPDDE